MNNKSFVVFLDVDGVLISRTTVQRTPDGYQGIDDARVEILASVIRKLGEADIVLTSDWKDMKPNDADYMYLASKLAKYSLEISAHTSGQRYNRAAGVLEYLGEHPEVKEFVILDDCVFDFEDYEKLWERLLITNGIEKVNYASRTPAVEAILFLEYIGEF